LARALITALASVSLLAACSNSVDLSSPPAWPGPPWSKDGRVVSSDVLELAAGPAHCGWQSAAFLTIGWPLGRTARYATQARQYIRDPNGVVAKHPRTELDLHTKLPFDARPPLATQVGRHR